METVTFSREEILNRSADCTHEHLLKELACRAEYFFKLVDGSYELPRCGGQAEQVLEMAIAAHIKSQ